MKVMPIENLEERVSEEETALKGERSKLDRVKTLKINGNTWRSVAEKKNCCEVCRREFQGNEMQEFLQQLVDSKNLL